MTPAEILKALDQVTYDLSVTRTRVSELANAVKQLLDENAIPTSPPQLHCPDCGNTYRKQRDLDEHRYRAHDGPVPDHYRAAERLAGEAA